MAGSGTPLTGECPVRPPRTTPNRTLLRHREIRRGMIIMSEEAEKARQALQESMDLRDQGHTED